MKIFTLPLLLALAASPAPAPQTPPAPEGAPEGVPEGDGFNLMEEGAKLLFRGLMAEVEPSLDDMGRALSELEPALRELQPMLRDMIAMVDDLSNYHAPEKLPNGDIILRRKLPSELAPPRDLNQEYEL